MSLKYTYQSIVEEGLVQEIVLSLGKISLKRRLISRRALDDE
jgi:hypothetical protein